MKACVLLITVLLVLTMGCIEEEEDDKNERPVARLDLTGAKFNLGESVTFDATASKDPDGNIVQYMFWFGDGDNSGTRTTGFWEHTYEEPGVMTVTLVVWDDKGTVGTDTKVITINDPPVADMIIVNGQGNVTTEAWVKEQLSFDATASSDSDGFLLNASTIWEFGDGSTANGLEVTHTYLTNDTYQVNLTVEDNDEATTTISNNITVTMHRYRATWDDTTYEQMHYEFEYPMVDKQTREFSVDFEQVNITRIWVNFTWDDAIIPEDEFTLRVDTPHPDNDFMQETTLSEEILFHWERAYKSLDFWAPDSADARQHANGKDMTDTDWSGTYNFTIHLETNGVFPLIDNDEQYTLSVYIEYYRNEPTVEQLD